ncbi:MAG: hypothetical protein AAB367_04780 [Patescibacteria group bacterium]
MSDKKRIVCTEKQLVVVRALMKAMAGSGWLTRGEMPVILADLTVFFTRRQESFQFSGRGAVYDGCNATTREIVGCEGRIKRTPGGALYVSEIEIFFGKELPKFYPTSFFRADKSTNYALMPLFIAS